MKKSEIIAINAAPPCCSLQVNNSRYKNVTKAQAAQHPSALHERIARLWKRHVLRFVNGVLCKNASPVKTLGVNLPISPLKT